MSSSIFHPEFKARPYWWEAIPMGENPATELPPQTQVVIIGGGLTGLNCAIELARAGTDVVVLEAGDFGFGASTRNGGGVSGGTSMGKGFSGKQGANDLLAAMVGDAADSLAHIEALIARENIECQYVRSGRYLCAYTPGHYEALAAKVDLYNEQADAGAEMIPRERQREEIASDYYHGGMLVRRSGKIHPALYHRGLMAAAEKYGAILVGNTKAGALTRTGDGWRVQTSRGEITAEEVVIATNGYTGELTPDLKRRLIPVASHIIATEPLDADLARSLIPNGRTLADTRRVLCYWRMSPDGTRVLFGGRARFTQVPPEVSAPALHSMMLDRWPQLKGVRITHAWTGNVAFAFDYLPHTGRTQQGLHYAMACNGSGVSMLSYLGFKVARRLIGGDNQPTTFEDRDFPTKPLYSGNPWFLPAVGAYYRMRDWIDRRYAA